MRSQEQCLPSKPGTEPPALRLDISGIVLACSQGTTQDLGETNGAITTPGITIKGLIGTFHVQVNVKLSMKFLSI